MSVSRREVHEFRGLMRQKSLKIDLQEMLKNFPADFDICGVNRHDKSDYEKIIWRRGTEQSEKRVFPVILGDFGAWSDSWGINTFSLDIILTSSDPSSQNQRICNKLGQYASHVFGRKPIDYEQIGRNRSYVSVTLGQLRVLEAELHEFSDWDASKY